MRKIKIDERDFSDVHALMAQLKEALDFPDYFGESPAALRDCLGDICEPTRITIVRRDPTPDTWFDRASSIIVRASLENECLSVRIR